MKPAARASSNVEWKRWGRVDPFYGVAAWPGRERGGSHPWTADDFYALGQSDWSDFRARWVRYGVDFGRAVDVGCGAGRLSKAMAADFESVIGVDVSDAMLDVAQANIPEPNVTLRLGDGVTLPVETAAVDAAFSAHVFQHFDSLELARANFLEVARVLEPGGTAMIHLPVVMTPAGLPGVDLAMRAKWKVGDVRAAVQRRRGAPFSRGLQYQWTWLVRTLPAVGLVDVELVVFPMVSNGGYHACVLARRSRT